MSGVNLSHTSFIDAKLEEEHAPFNQAILRPPMSENIFAQNYDCRCIKKYGCGTNSGIMSGRQGEVHKKVSWNRLINAYMPDPAHYSGWQCTLVRNLPN